MGLVGGGEGAYAKIYSGRGMYILFNSLHLRTHRTVYVILNICVICLSQGVANQTGMSHKHLQFVKSYFFGKLKNTCLYSTKKIDLMLFFIFPLVQEHKPLLDHKNQKVRI